MGFGWPAYEEDSAQAAGEVLTPLPVLFSYTFYVDVDSRLYMGN